MAGVRRGGDPCQPSAAGFSVQARDGETKTTNGPVHAGSPWLNGYWVLDCKHGADAMRLGRQDAGRARHRNR